MMKTQNESLVQMIWKESLLITDSSNLSNESLKQMEGRCREEGTESEHREDQNHDLWYRP